MRKVRLLAVDLDFTLLDTDRTIAEENRVAIREATAAGIHVVLASGRIASGMRQYAEELGLSSPLISCNGAYVISGQGAVISEHRIGTADVQQALEFFWDRGAHAHVYRGDEILLGETNRWTEIYLNRVRRASHRVVESNELWAQPAHKVIALASPEQADQLAAEARAVFSGRAVSVIRSEPEYVEMISEDANKGRGLAAVAAWLGVSRSETAAIGDYHNDLPMLEWAGLSAAVGNAPEEVKQAADIVVSPYNSGGVREFVTHLVHNASRSIGRESRP